MHDVKLKTFCAENLKSDLHFYNRELSAIRDSCGTASASNGTTPANYDFTVVGMGKGLRTPLSMGLGLDYLLYLQDNQVQFFIFGVKMR